MGYYVDLRKTKEGNLRFIPKPELADDADLFRELSEINALSDMLLDYLETGWEWIKPEEIGALTSGDIITDSAERDGAELVSVGRVYWDSDYAVQSTRDELLAGRAIEWCGHE